MKNSLLEETTCDGCGGVAFVSDEETPTCVSCKGDTCQECGECDCECSCCVKHNEPDCNYCDKEEKWVCEICGCTDYKLSPTCKKNGIACRWARKNLCSSCACQEETISIRNIEFKLYSFQVDTLLDILRAFSQSKIKNEQKDN